MKPITFITGNPKKAEYLSRYLDYPIEHIKVDLDEIQSLDLKEIVNHKVREAYVTVQKPVLVEDVSLEIHALGKLPGPFIKFFMQELWDQKICDLINNYTIKSATAKCMFGYHDGNETQFFEWSIDGIISTIPKGKNGFWWDRIFIPYFTNKTAAELTEEEYERFYTEEKPFDKIREFLKNNQ